MQHSKTKRERNKVSKISENIRHLQPNPQNSVTGRFLVFFTAVLWGTSGTAQELAPLGATSAVVGTARLMICAVFIFVITAGRGELKSWRILIRPIFLLTGFTQAVFHLSYFGGIAHTGVTIGTMVAIGSCPIFAGLLGGVLDQERFSKTWITATTLALLGLTILLWAGGQPTKVNTFGISLALIAGFSYTFFTWITRRLVGKMPVEAVLSISFLIGSLFLIPVAVQQPLGWISSSDRKSVV